MKLAVFEKKICRFSAKKWAKNGSERKNFGAIRKSGKKCLTDEDTRTFDRCLRFSDFFSHFSFTTPFKNRFFGGAKKWHFGAANSFAVLFLPNYILGPITGKNLGIITHNLVPLRNGPFFWALFRQI